MCETSETTKESVVELEGAAYIATSLGDGLAHGLVWNGAGWPSGSIYAFGFYGFRPSGLFLKKIARSG